MFFLKSLLVYVIKNIVRVSFIFLITFLFSTKSNAQQIPHYTQYLYNMQILNPAHVGLRSDVSISLLSRQQWVGFEGAPTTNTFSISGRTYSRLGLGLSVVNDKIGFTSLNNINFDASYTLPISKKSRVSLGLKFGMDLFDNNFNQAITPDNDIYESFNGRYLNIGFGALYYTSNFFIGASMPYILEGPIYRQANNAGTRDLNYQNFFISAGAVFSLSENFNIRPSFIIKNNENLPLTFDLNSNLIYKNLIEAGVSYRYKNSVNLIFAILLNEKFRVGYSYDYTVDNLGEDLSSHEIILTIDFKLNRSFRWLTVNRCLF